MLSDLARHCIMMNALCLSLIILAVCMVLMEPLGDVGQGRNNRKLSVCLFANSGSYGQALNLLNLAFYPLHTTVNLYVVSAVPVEPVWHHGQYRNVQRFPQFDGSECVILLNDTMEVSPVYSFWFLHSCDRSVVSGGEAGLALSGRVWERFAASSGESYESVAEDARKFIVQHNLTVVYPEFLGKEYTFVRSKRQDPILPEQLPKLARGLGADFFAVG